MISKLRLKMITNYLCKTTLLALSTNSSIDNPMIRFYLTFSLMEFLVYHVPLNLLHSLSKFYITFRILQSLGIFGASPLSFGKLPIPVLSSRFLTALDLSFPSPNSQVLFCINISNLVNYESSFFFVYCGSSAISLAFGRSIPSHIIIFFD